MSRRLDIFAERRNYGRGIELRIAKLQHPDSDKRHVAQPLSFVEGDADLMDEPAVTLSMTDAQHLMDELWRCGLRPTEGTGSAGSLAAVERHLKDMQAITKGLLKKEGIET